MSQRKVQKNLRDMRSSRPRRRVSESPVPRSSSSISPERVKFDDRRSRYNTPAPAHGVCDSIEYLSDPMSIYSSPSPSKKSNTASKQGRKPCGHRSAFPSRMSESPVRSDMSSPSMGWSRIATTGHSSNTTLNDTRTSMGRRGSSKAGFAGSEASSSSGFDMDIEIDIGMDPTAAPGGSRFSFEPSRAEQRRPKRGADELYGLADMMRGLSVGQKRARHRYEEKTEPSLFHAKVVMMDNEPRIWKKIDLDKLPRRISSGNILAKCINIPAFVKPVVEKDRSKLRRRRDD